MKLHILIIILILSCSAFGQRDRWNGLIIDESSTDDAIKILGTPASDKLDELKVLMVKPWLSKESRDQKYRHLEFKNIKEFSRLKLAFLDDKLVFIELKPSKNLPLPDVELLKDLEGRYVYDADDISGTPGLFPKVRRRRSFETNPGREYKIGASDKTFLVCLLNFGTPSTTSEGFSTPVYVGVLQIISRKLER